MTSTERSLVLGVLWMVINAGASVPAILHQWDRHASLAERIEVAR